jgi:Domain of unknown function (DUF4304)
MTDTFRKKAGLAFHSVLKPRGFKKEGLHWKRQRREYVDLIDVQVSQWDSTFTLNLGVGIPDVSTRLFPKGRELKYAADGVVEDRLGMLAHDNYDFWWNKLNDIDVDSAAAALECFGVPFLDKFQTRELMIEWLERKGYSGKNPSFPQAQYLALLYIDVGRTADGCDSLRKILTRLKSDSPWMLPVKNLLARYCG